MPLIRYTNIEFSPDKLELIAKANAIIREYSAQGFNLTLRQLYYQFVSRDLLPASWANKAGVLNRPESYNKLGDLVSDGRMAGLIDWYAIVDRSRASYAARHYDRPSRVIEAALASYATDKWENQPNYVEVWVEKEALEDVIGRACGPLDVRYFACKGYTSQSAMWEASERFIKRMAEGKAVHIIHLGDHDPSGIDMSRDIEERMSTFVHHNWDGRGSFQVHRIALNMDQIEQFQPPPNPAKATDSRFREYQEKFGDESWELDALEPGVLVKLITDEVLRFRDQKLWDEAVERESKGRRTIQMILTYFTDVVQFLRERRQKDDSRVICAGCGATVNNPTCQCAGTENRGGILL